MHDHPHLDPATGTPVVLAPRRPRSVRVRAVLALGGVVGLGIVGTGAAFSDSATVTAELTAGTLDIAVDGEEGNPTPYELVVPGSDAIAPGETLHSPLLVSNVGSVDADLSLSVATTPDGSIANATDDLRLVIAHGAAGTCDAAVVAADPAPYVADGPLASAAFSDVELGGGESVELCLAVELPSGVSGTGGGATEVELSFLAEQAGA